MLGLADGDAADNAGNMSCHRMNYAQTGTCRAMFFVGIVGTRTIVINATRAAGYSGINTCIGTSTAGPYVCAAQTSLASNVVMSPDGRYTRAVDFRPLDPAAVTVNKVGGGTGTVVSDPPAINCGSTCTYAYFFKSQSLTLTASPGGSSLFAGWGSGPCQGQDETCTYTPSGNATIDVTFANPTPPPTQAPTAPPTAAPTAKPTAAPTAKPTAKPTAAPTLPPGGTAAPTAAVTAAPSVVIIGPSVAPTESASPIDTPEPTAAVAPTPTLPPLATPQPDPVPTAGQDEGFPVLGILLSLAVAVLAVFFVYRRQARA
jgi:hypothetical protein